MGEPGWYPTAKYYNVHFNGFAAETRYGQSQVIMTLLSMPDYLMPQEFFDCSFTDVENAAMALLDDPSPGWANLKDCGDFPCTAPWNTHFAFTRTEYFGDVTPAITLPEFFIIPDNPGFSPFQEDACIESPENNMYICAGYANFGTLQFMSLDDDNMDRSSQPIYLWEEGSEEYNTLNAFMDHGWDGFYTSQKRLQRFPALINADNTVYNITYTGTVPQKQKFSLIANEGSGVTIKIHYTSAITFGIYGSDGLMFDQNSWDDDLQTASPILQEYCGENRWIAVESKLEFYITPNCELTIKPRNVIQAMVRMQWTMDSFFSDGGTTAFVDRLCGVLGIHASTMKVVTVYEGSVVVDYEIEDEEEEIAEDATDEEIALAEAESLARLAAV